MAGPELNCREAVTIPNGASVLFKERKTPLSPQPVIYIIRSYVSELSHDPTDSGDAMLGICTEL